MFTEVTETTVFMLQGECYAYSSDLSASVTRSKMSLSSLLVENQKRDKNAVISTTVFFLLTTVSFQKTYKVIKDNMENLIILKG